MRTFKSLQDLAALKKEMKQGKEGVAKQTIDKFVLKERKEIHLPRCLPNGVPGNIKIIHIIIL